MKKHKTDHEKNIYIADSADVVGDVTLGEGVSVWYQTVIRGDADSITIGKDTNIQDGSLIHMDPGYPVVIGERVTVGHKALLHGCRVGDESLIGMGAIVLTGAVIGRHCLIGAGALVTQNMVIPDGMLVLGAPAKVIRPVREEEIAMFRGAAEEYLHLAKEHFSGE